ncbi:hypothetical protein [Desulfovibrio sp. JC022]|uniref:hypothetical protein n=1 Tax=Desulfovibrio sp. JC022 TaxID=2593642 RepID=UPI0013D282D5|nr:hypothetical protein [Desulfovibrio sp. JC022]NDV24695.1 hypothetical protein [Desulfovibrio sp. JC022]
MHLKYMSRFFAAFVFFTLMNTPAYAHRVSIFAYIEGNTVYTESYFSKKRKVHKGKLEVFSTKTGEELLKGVTDNNGNFNFPIPEAIKVNKSGLLINLYASEGHRAVWTLNADEIFPDTEETTPAASIKDSPVSTAETPPLTSPAGTTPETSSQEIAELTTQVKTLTNKVETLKRLIISQQEKGPGVNEIFSGIGYILGLFGVAAFFLSKKK